MIVENKAIEEIDKKDTASIIADPRIVSPFKSVDLVTEPADVRSCFEDEPEQVSSFLERNNGLPLDVRLSAAFIERMALDSVGLYSNVSIDLPFALLRTEPPIPTAQTVS